MLVAHTAPFMPFLPPRVTTLWPDSDRLGPVRSWEGWSLSVTCGPSMAAYLVGALMSGEGPSAHDMEHQAEAQRRSDGSFGAKQWQLCT